MPPLRIFISYGRDQYAPLAARLAADLTSRGYEVWYDQQLQSGRSWARGIQKQLDWLVEVPQNGRFIYLLSTHSTREKSFCLSELQYAIDNQVPVFPILLEKCKIPIEIYPLQRLDLRPCLPVEQHPAEYAHLLQTLVEDMEGGVETRMEQQSIIGDKAPKENPNLPPPSLSPQARQARPPQKPAPPPAGKPSMPQPVPTRHPPFEPEADRPQQVPPDEVSKPSQTLPPPPAAAAQDRQPQPQPALPVDGSPASTPLPELPVPAPSTPPPPPRGLDQPLSRFKSPPLRIAAIAAACLLVIAILAATIPGGLALVFAPATPTATRTIIPTSTITPSITPTPTITPSPTSTLVPPACVNLGQTWTSPLDGMKLLCVPASEFLMGSSDADRDAYPNEKPQHAVHLDAFWIDQTEVTNAMYQKCIASGKCTGSSAAKGDNYPVVNVSWTDAQAYCAWAGRQLPSEAQWENAARGTDGRIYPWGNIVLGASQVNLSSSVKPVGSFPAGASPYGALDMAGNVWEWVADWFGETYYSSQDAWRNPTGPATGMVHSVRGGSWLNADRDLRAASRWYYPYYWNDFLGFRCCRR